MKKNLYLIICFCTLILVSGCTKIHKHSAKDSYPEKKTKKRKSLFYLWYEI